MLPLELNILTLNIWGIPLVSKDRQARVDAIGNELSSGSYDIVSLQEVWSQADYESIVNTTRAVLPYAHYFYSGVIGAGLLVLSKYPIIGTLFHAWSVNGYFHRIQHADWFGGKGVGLCRILVKNQVVHLYNAHLHAEYDNENDDYKTHRVIQAFDTAQFIRATRDDAVLQILAGDLNTKPDDISYRMLLYVSKMEDSCPDSSVATNECPRNSYTKKHALERNSVGIRIDHIFWRSASHASVNIIKYTLPLPERVPGMKFSYSDHEGVLATMRIIDKVTETESIKELPAIAVCEVQNDGCIKSDYVHLTPNDNCSPNDILPNLEVNAVSQRIGALHEAIALCDASLQDIKVDRIFYYSFAIFAAFFLIIMGEYSVPLGFKTLYLIVKFIMFAVITYCIFMGSIWNYMERHGVLAGRMDMEVVLRSTEQFELTLNT